MYNMHLLILAMHIFFRHFSCFYVLLLFLILGSDLERSYTPVRPLLLPNSTHSLPSRSESRNSASNNSTIELLIKLYKDGAMSQHLAKLSPGDKLRVGDPEGTFEATRLNGITDALLVAAGSGESCFMYSLSFF